MYYFFFISLHHNNKQIEIMELNKNHRESLLEELQKAKNDLERGKRLLKQFEGQEQSDNFQNWREIDIFLAEQRIKLIEKSLIDNEIDF